MRWAKPDASPCTVTTETGRPAGIEVLCVINSFSSEADAERQSRGSTFESGRDDLSPDRKQVLVVEMGCRWIVSQGTRERSVRQGGAGKHDLTVVPMLQIEKCLK